MMKRLSVFLSALLILCACGGRGGRGSAEAEGAADSLSALELVKPRYATGYTVKDSAGMRLVEVGEHERFALVNGEGGEVPQGYTRIEVPVERTICMTALQLSNFTILDAHDVVKGITGTKNLFNPDILARTKDGRIVKIGMEGNFDTEMVLAANPQGDGARCQSAGDPHLALEARWL